MAALVARTGAWTLQVIKRSDLRRFVVLPKRWIVERTLAWISRNRRLARNYERHTRKAAVFVRLAMSRLKLRHLAVTRSKGDKPMFELDTCHGELHECTSLVNRVQHVISSR